MTRVALRRAGRENYAKRRAEGCCLRLAIQPPDRGMGITAGTDAILHGACVGDESLRELCLEAVCHLCGVAQILRADANLMEKLLIMSRAQTARRISEIPPWPLQEFAQVQVGAVAHWRVGEA